MSSSLTQYDVIIVGGGLYGCILALFLKERFQRVVILEKEASLLGRASFNNQARVHNGYHYPRNMMTALRSRVNFTRFKKEFADCIDESFDQYYAIAQSSPNVNAAKFQRFFDQINAPLEIASKSIHALFDAETIERVFRVQECAFDADRLRTLLLERLAAAGVEIRFLTTVEKIAKDNDGTILLSCSNKEDGIQTISASHVFNCTYAMLNSINVRSGLPIIPLKHELTELALVEVPSEFRHIGITVMDGPFFSLMPFPARGLHSLSHVRYTPHTHWFDTQDGTQATEFKKPRESNFVHMVRDAARFVPLVSDCQYRESLWEVKTILPKNEGDDGRPILYKQDHGGMKNYACILGGKIDNVYDILDKVQIT